MRSVARPRIFGPTELNVTLTTASTSTTTTFARCGRSLPSRRLADGPKFERLLPRLAHLHVRRTAPSGRAASGLGGLLLRGLDSLGHQAASSALRWDSTISR